MKKNEVLVIDPQRAGSVIKSVEYKAAQVALLKKHPLIDIIDGDTFEAAKKSAFALRTARTDLEKDEKTIVTKITAFRKNLGSIFTEITEVTQGRETEFKTRIRDWETKKEREAAALAEELRIKKELLEQEINGIFFDFSQKIIDVDFYGLDALGREIKEKFLSIDSSEYGDSQGTFDEGEIAINLQMRNRVNTLTIAENQRLAQVQIDTDKKEAAAEELRLEKLAEKQANESLRLENLSKKLDAQALQNDCIATAIKLGFEAKFGETNIYIKGGMTLNINFLGDTFKLGWETAQEITDWVEAEELEEAKKIEVAGAIIVEPVIEVTDTNQEIVAQVVETEVKDEFTFPDDLAETPLEGKFTPFGDEWRKEVNKMNKTALIDLLRTTCIELKELKLHYNHEQG